MAPVPTWRHRTKRVLDAVLSLAGLIAVFPLMGVIALAIRAGSAGPVIYAQERVGLSHRPFRMLKFRSMHENAEAKTGPTWCAKHDGRVTAVGRVLRATHLDELPQLWNVLRGEMSLVGPRPERPHFVHQFEREIPGYAERFAVLPGITGLGQLRSGYDDSLRSVRRKTRYDRIYVRHVGPLLDAALLAGTVVHVMAHGGPAFRPAKDESAPPHPDRVRRRPAVAGVLGRATHRTGRTVGNLPISGGATGSAREPARGIGTNLGGDYRPVHIS